MLLLLLRFRFERHQLKTQWGGGRWECSSVPCSGYDSVHWVAAQSRYLVCKHQIDISYMGLPSWLIQTADTSQLLASVQIAVWKTSARPRAVDLTAGRRRTGARLFRSNQGGVVRIGGVQRCLCDCSANPYVADVKSTYAPPSDVRGANRIRRWPRGGTTTYRRSSLRPPRGPSSRGSIPLAPASVSALKK